MGKHFRSSKKPNLQIEGNNNNNNHGAGCMWGILHILDYHHWHVKRVLPHKRHGTYKRKTILHNEVEDQQDGDAESKPLLVTQHGKKLRGKGKGSLKNRKKGQHTEESLHLEYLDEKALHLEKDGKTTEGSLNQTQTETNKLESEITNKFKKRSDILEVISVEKDLLLRFIRELDVGWKKSHQASQNLARLTKSGSFPLAASSSTRSISTRSRTFKHKQTEIWVFPKGEKLLVGTQAEKLSSSSLVSDMKEKPSIPSRSSQGGNHKGWNQSVLHSFKVIKQKIKHVLDEAIHHRASAPANSITNDEKEVSQILEHGVIQEHKKNEQSNEIKASDYDANKAEVRLMRRTSSLNESLDRYTQLFEKSFSKDVKWNSSKSKSLRLTNEDKSHKSGTAPKFSRSNFSLPSLESIGFILHEALLDANDTVDTSENGKHLKRKSLSLNLQTDKSLDQIKETEIAETVEGGDSYVNLSDKIEEEIDEGVTCDQREDIHEPAEENESFPHEKVEISMPSKDLIASFETSSEDNTTSHAEGGELNDRGAIMEESETDLAERESVHSLASSLNASVTAKDTDKSLDNHYLLHKSVTVNDSNFKYVKNILEVSGFMGNEQNQTWHTVDQPLKPSLLKDLEKEIESSEEEIVSYDNLLLFNLVNEVLLEMHDMSPTYFPRPFSFNHRLRPMPKGNYLLHEVWSSVNSYLSLRPELDQTLDDVVRRDLAKGRGWMNLQQEEEHVALELEEMIMDDLLDELIFS